IREVSLPGCDHAHGLHLDGARRLAFVACDQNAKLLVLDLKTMRVRQTLSVGDDPDVLDFDTGLRRVYVASESGQVAVFTERGRVLRKLGQAKLADNAHSVAVDLQTHLVYFPLANAISSAIPKIICDVDESCTTSPFSRHRIRSRWGSPIDSAGTSGETGQNVSSDLPRVH